MQDYQAVILAAGMGIRLRSLLQETPKGFISVGGKSLIEHSIDNLRFFGIEDIVIVTGYQSERFDELAGEGNGIRTIRNDRFADSSSMYSFHIARPLIDRDILLLESDLIYEKRGLQALLASPLEDAVLLSGPTHAGDEVYVSGSCDRMTGASKDIGELDGEVVGEWVGVCKISGGLQREMFRWAESEYRRRGSLKVDYETDCMAGVAADHAIGCVKVEDLAWSEVDDEDHLRRLHELVSPRILKNDERFFGQSNTEGG